MQIINVFFHSRNAVSPRFSIFVGLLIGTTTGLFFLHNWLFLTQKYGIFINRDSVFKNEIFLSRLSENLNNTIQPKIQNKTESTDPNSNRTFSFQFIIPAKNICSTSTSKEITVMVIVCSGMNNTDRRQAIRETWGSEARKNGNTGAIRVAFLVGSSLNSTDNNLVQHEARTKLDIIQADFIDSYENLTYKSLAMLKWARNFCPNASFVVKSDDDIYINFANLIRATAQIGTKNDTMFGHLLINGRPRRRKSHKWFVPKSMYPEKRYPNYLIGPTYVMTGKSVPKIFTACRDQPFITMEDIFVTGFCAASAGIVRRNMQGFPKPTLPPTGCVYQNVVIGHKVTVLQMRKIWNELQNKNAVC